MQRSKHGLDAEESSGRELRGAWAIAERDAEAAFDGRRGKLGRVDRCLVMIRVETGLVECGWDGAGACCLLTSSHKRESYRKRSQLSGDGVSAGRCGREGVLIDGDIHMIRKWLKEESNASLRKNATYS